MSRSAGSGIVLDLSANGATTITPAPGSSQTFTLPAPKLGANGNYPRAARIVVRVKGTVDNNAEGADPIPWTELARIVSTFETRCPLYGTIHNSDTFTGPVAKHVAEFLSCGYSYYGGRGAALGVTGSEAFDISFALPLSHEAFFSPLDFAPWVGWLTQLQLIVNFAPSTVFQAVSDGAAISGNLTVSAWIEAVPTKTLELPSVNQFRAYYPPASGGTTALLQNIGSAGGLSCVVPGSRLAAIAEMMPVAGLGGATGATEAGYTNFSADQLNQPQTTNLISFVEQMQMLERNSGQTQALTPRNEAGTLMYYPWRVPGADAEIGSQQKFQGNLTLLRNFASPLSTGQFVLVTNELRQLSEDSAGALLEAASVSKARADAAKRAYYDGPTSRRSSFALPVRIPNG